MWNAYILHLNKLCYKIEYLSLSVCLSLPPYLPISLPLSLPLSLPPFLSLSLLHTITAYLPPYIIAFTTDTIEIRMISNGSLIQSIDVPGLKLISKKVNISIDIK